MSSHSHCLKLVWCPRNSCALALLFLCLICGSAQTAQSGQVLINEIMYHPARYNTAEEYIELYNPGPDTVDLTGWRFTKGITFTFPPVNLAPNNYLVLAADPAAFQLKYPSVVSVVGPWRGSLSNNGEEVSLANAAGQKADSVRYATEGDWGVRTKAPLDYGHRGWTWLAEHDGLGNSLERISAAMPNEGQNWGSSKNAGGTPGARNSIARANIAPLILKTAHAPVIPKPSNPVTVTAKIVDEQPGRLDVTIFFRVDGTRAFSFEPMFDDGEHGDNQRGDRVYGIFLPAHSSGRIVEFYIEAIDSERNRRTFPAPVQSGTQSANLLYQVDRASPSGAQPQYRLIMTKAERDELEALSAVFDDTLSNAQMNGTFISVDKAGTELRYLVGLRNRGNGTRIKLPHNFRVNFRNDQTWKGVETIELNTQFTHAQVLGGTIFQRAGIPAADARPVQVRVNNASLAKAGSPQFGSYAAVETLDKDFLENHIPKDSKGNLYRGKRSLFPAKEEANLAYLGDQPRPYRENYIKQNNTSENDWADLIDFCRVLSPQTPDAIYPREVYRVLNVDQFMRYLALNALIENEESTINTGIGDDYALYRGEKDQRFIFIAHDHDTILNIGDDPGFADAGLFRSTGIPAIKRLLNSPDFRPLYFWHLQDLIETTFSATTFNAMVDEVLGYVPAKDRTKIKNFASARRQFVRSQIPAVIRPAIARQPLSYSARSGEVVTFSVDAVGTLPLNYQWYHDGLPVSGANGSSLLVMAAPFETGSYTVTIANSGGSLTSLSASLSLGASGFDTDGDGLPDDWEILQGFNLSSPADAAEDADGDTATNLQEYLSGTDPRNPQSRLSLQAQRLADGQVALSFFALPGRTYAIEYRDTLAGGSWIKWTDFAPAAVGQETRMTDAVAGGSGPRFYRLVTSQ